MERTPVTSSNIASIGYDSENAVLEVEFLNGTIYQYYDVPEEEYHALISAPSVGSFLHHNIKNRFNYSKI